MNMQNTMESKLEVKKGAVVFLESLLFYLFQK